jgi:hypothetical protein
VHAPYCHHRPVWLYPVSPHYLRNDMIFGGRERERELLNIKYVLIFSTPLSAIFLILKSTEKKKKKNA